jgi:hypothetical protein
MLDDFDANPYGINSNFNGKFINTLATARLIYRPLLHWCLRDVEENYVQLQIPTSSTN